MPLRTTLHRLHWMFLVLLVFTVVQPANGETFRNPRRIPLSVDPYGVATGDLDGDGRNDIVWTEHPPYPGAAVLHVLLGGTDGQYTSMPDLSLPFRPTAIQCVIEDVTGDKQTDLVCVGAADDYTNVYLLTYIGKGNGTFTAPVQTKVTTQPNLSYPIIGRAGDLNGDGVADVVVTDGASSTVLPYLSDGAGGFTYKAAVFGSFNFAVPVVTDLNGDGKLDILWPTGPRVSLGNGDGTFSAPVQYDAGFDSNCAFGDVDHDGHLDAVCTWYDNGDLDGFIHLTVLQGNADGSFSKTPLFTRTFGNGENEYDGIPTILSPVLVTDLNGDGYADIVSLSGDGYCVLLGGPNATWNGPTQQFVAATFQIQGGLLGLYGGSIADMNGDGLPDIVSVGANGLYITYAQRDGTLSSAPAYELGQISTSATLVDVNGDGNLDVVSAGDNALKLSLGRGDGTFSPPQAITTSGNFGNALYAQGRVISGDFNGDGKQDLLATGNVAAYTTQNYILFGHGDGTFTDPSPTNIPLGKVADLNGDGRSDVLSLQNNSTSGNVLAASISVGDGTFTSKSTNLPAEPTPNGFLYPVVGPALADFRHSGSLDVAVASANNAYFLRSHGDGTFDSAGVALAIPDLPNLNRTGVYDVAAGDFDGDGNPDIAVLMQYGSGIYNLSTPTSAVWVYYGKGDGTFSSAVHAGSFNRDAQTLTTGDLNGDGLADLVLTSYNVYQDTGVLIVHALPNRLWGPEVDYTGGEGLSPLWITDINHDGRNDLIFSNAHRLNEATNSISVLLNEAANTVTGTVTAMPEPSNVTFPFTLSATLIPSNAADVLSGTVSFSVDGSVVGTGSLTGNVASITLSGSGWSADSHSIGAFWSGDSTYPPLTLSGTHVVSLLPLQLSLATMPATINSGASVTATTTLVPEILPNQGNPQFTAAVTLYDNGMAIAQQPAASGLSFTLPPLAAGTHVLSASYAGDSIFAAARSNSVTVTVTGLATVSNLIADPPSATYGTPIILSAGVAATTYIPSPTPTGTLVFLVDGKPMAPITLVTPGALVVLNNLSVGTHTASCTYSGDATFGPSTCNTVSIVISPAASTISITSSQNPSVAFVPVTFTIHLTLDGHPAPAGTQLTFSLMSNSGNNLLATDANGNATYTTNQLFARTWDTVALFSGANYQASSTSYRQIVTAAPTALSLTGSPNPAYFGQAVTFSSTLTASGTTFPTGVVTFHEGTTMLGTGTIDRAGHAAFSTAALPVGTHAISATYPGDTGFQAATSAYVTEVITPSDVVLTLDHDALTIQTEHHSSVRVSLASIGGLSGTFELTCGTMPAWSTCYFGSNTLTLSANGTVTTTLEIDTDAVYHFKSALDAPTLPSHPASRLPLLALVPFACWTVRRRRARVLQALYSVTALGVLLLCASSLTGCGDKYPDHTAPGSYAIQVTATSVDGTTPVPMSRANTLKLLVTP